MTAHYHRQGNPYFSCCLARLQHGGDSCQSFNGRWLESLIAELVVQVMEPASLQLSLQASETVEEERERLDRHHRQSVERATYSVDLARRRYKEVDPANRLVAGELERDLEAALQHQRRTEEELNRFRLRTPPKLSKSEISAINALSNDFQGLWDSAGTSDIDRQNLVRILIDQIEVEAVSGTERLLVTVHWAGGFTSHYETRRCVQTFDNLEDSEVLLKRAQWLYNLGYSQTDMIRQLNGEGFQPARAEKFTTTSFPALMLCLRRKGMIRDRPILPENFWRASHLAKTLGIANPTLTQWRHRGWVQAATTGSRWIYWANEEEIERLTKLKSSHVNGMAHSGHLTKPCSRMPDLLDSHP